ncbi:peptidase [Portibacter marinus]|uniref:peptidase n=1 Tax=Portibacter marinus TaxID=2898660 RepID=UPI001F192B6A|nr:peptidase [Portibacter marinus]
MTYCLGIRVKQGLVALADTRITMGTETTTAKKISLHKTNHGTVFLMTSGLRSIRDKAVIYFEDVLKKDGENYDRMYNVANAFGAQLRKVAQEDKEALAASGLNFNLYTIVGGKLSEDHEPKLFLLYPEGNWIEIGTAAPFTIIGNSGYGKPILNRTLNYQSTLRFALKTGFLSFDSTRVSANDVGFPIDVVILKAETGEIIEKRFEENELKDISRLWGEKLSDIIREIPEEWIDKINTLSDHRDDEAFISLQQ